jgi:hypothetical protein
MPQNVPPFDELFASCHRTALHLELRDAYAVDYEVGEFADWRAGRLTADRYAERWDDFQDWVQAAVARGVAFRRLRVVSTPVSEYTRFEYAGTPANIKSGEDVRWLPRAEARDLLLPANDCWIFDGVLIRWAFFDGEGHVVERQVEENPGLAAKLTDAFDAAWPRATPHHAFVV